MEAAFDLGAFDPVTKVAISFPEEFESGLGMSGVCTAYHRSDKSGTLLSCSVINRTIHFKFSEINSGFMELELKDVVNPLMCGETGVFRVTTFSEVLISADEIVLPSVRISCASADFLSSSL